MTGVKKTARRKTRALSDAKTSRVFSEMAEMPDRVVAILAVSLLEGALEKSLANRMVRMNAQRHNSFFHQTPMRNYSLKVELGECLAIYGREMKADLIKFGTIRNEFAHSVKNINFETLNIKNIIQSLRTVDLKFLPFIGYSVLGDKYPWLGGRTVYAEMEEEIRSSIKLSFIYAASAYRVMVATNTARPTRERHPWGDFTR